MLTKQNYIDRPELRTDSDIALSWASEFYDSLTNCSNGLHFVAPLYIWRSVNRNIIINIKTIIINIITTVSSSFDS